MPSRAAVALGTGHAGALLAEPLSKLVTPIPFPVHGHLQALPCPPGRAVVTCASSSGLDNVFSTSYLIIGAFHLIIGTN